MSDLIAFLSDDSHTITAGDNATAATLQAAFTKGSVPITFTDTDTPTEVTIKVDAGESDDSGAEWDAGTGAVHIEGTVTLEGKTVRCVADLDLASLTGLGYLETT